MEFQPIYTTNKGRFMSPPPSWSLSINPQIPFLTPPPSPVRFAPSPANCTPSQYVPLPSVTVQQTRNENNLHNWIPSSVPQFPYPPPGINYNIPQRPTTCLNSCIDRQIAPQEFLNVTKWPHPIPTYPRLPTNVINSGGWNSASRSVNSGCPQSFIPPTYPFEYNSFKPLANSTNNYTPPNRLCPETNFYGQSPPSKIPPIPTPLCNSNCASDSSNKLVPRQSFSPGYHIRSSLDKASKNLYEQSSYSGLISIQSQYHPPTPNHSRSDKDASVQISVCDLNLLLLPPPPPPLQSPPSPSFADQNVHTFQQQFPSLIDGSSVPNEGSMNQQTSYQNCLPQSSSCLLLQQRIFPLSCRNMNELELTRITSLPQNLHILHPPLRSILTVPMNDQLLSQVTLFKSMPNQHFPIEPVPPLSIRSMDEQTPLQVTDFQLKSCIPSNSVRLLPAVRRTDQSQVTLFQPNSFPTPGNINEHPGMHFPLFVEHYLPPLPPEEISPPYHNLLSVVNEQTPQKTSIAAYSGLNSVPYQSPSQEDHPPLLNMNNNKSHTLAQQDVSFDANSCFQSTSSQEPPLEYLPSTDGADKRIPTPKGLFDHNPVSPPTSESSEPIEYLPPLGSTDEETSPYRGSSQLTSTVLTIKSADGRETLEITTYDLYLLLLPPPPPPPYPPPPSPPPSPTPTIESPLEPTLLTTDTDTPEDQLPSESPSFAIVTDEPLESQSPSFATCSEDRLESKASAFEVHIPPNLPHFMPNEQPILPMAARNNNTAEGTFLPSLPNGIHLPLEVTSPVETICSMEESTPQQTLGTDQNSYFIPPSTLPVSPESVYVPPEMNLNQNTPSQMPLFSTRPHPTQLFSPPELSPVCDNTQKSVYAAPQYSNELPPPLSIVPLTDPKLPMLVVNTPDGALFWKPFRLPPPPLGPSAIAPFNVTGNCVLPPFNMNRLCTPPQFSKPVPPFNMRCTPSRFSKPMPPFNMNRIGTPPGFSKPLLVGNMSNGLAAPVPPLVSKLVCSPNQSPIIPARLIHLQARVPVYYSASAEKNGTETSNTKIILGA